MAGMIFRAAATHGCVPLQQLGHRECQSQKPPIPHHLTEWSNSRGVYLFTISKNKLDRLVACRNCSVNKFFILFCTLRQQNTSNASVYLVLVCEKKLTAG